MTEVVDDVIIPDMRELTDALKGLHLSAKSAISLDQTEADYVLDLDVQSSQQSSSPQVAATSSNFTIRLFSKETLASNGIISGHKNTITGVRFSRSNKDLLFSSSQDNSVRCWDLRAPEKAVQIFKGYTQAESLFTTFDISCNERVICTGSEVNDDDDAFLTFWDVRQASQMGCYSESHQDDITQVRFHPSQPHTLASGSTDGLVCVYDISQNSEDDALLTTLNSCSSVQKIGWCGLKAEDIYCVTHIDTFHIWNGLEGDSLLELTDVKDRTEKLCEVDYIVDCVVKGNASDSSRPVLLTGNHSGALQLLEVDNTGDEMKVRHVCGLTDGHTATVRCLHWDDQRETLITGAEDSLLCLWSVADITNQPSTNRHKKMRAKLKTTKSKKGRPY